MVRPKTYAGTRAVSARVRRSSQKTQNRRSAVTSKSIKYTPEQLKARRAKAKKIIAIAAGVTLAAALGYAAYKGSTNLRDKMRQEILNKSGQGYEAINTLNSKYWNAADRAKYSNLVKERSKMMANNTTRRDALVAKFYEKTGIRLNLPHNRARVLQERRSSQELGRFIRDAENREHLNRQIHDARANLKSAQKRLSTYNATPHYGVSKNYEALWKQKYTENADRYKDILNNLLKQRAGLAA